LIDSDLDGVNDTIEVALGSNPRSTDTDSDGISDLDEWNEGTDLNHWDTDLDLVPDGKERTFGSSPTMADSDGEGLSDYLEFLLNSNPNSEDTDMDGASDLLEYQQNSSLLHTDSDGDLAFDGAEYLHGSNPTDGDSDGDSIIDGYEYIYGSNPQSSDSDGDGVPDDLEISLLLDLMNPDSDGDSIDDWTELQWGSSPYATDSDWDGIPDNLDPDTFSEWDGPVVLVYSQDATNETLDFAAELAQYVDVIVTTLDDLLESYSDYPYIVLVGRPDPASYNVERLIYDLLEDTGTVLSEMMLPDSHEAAVRHGVWNSTQTVAILSTAFTSDVFTVLQILRGRDVTILPDYVMLDYDATAIIHSNNQTHYAVFVNSIDTIKATGSVVSLAFNGPVMPMFSITRYNETTSPHVFTHRNGLAADEVALHNYIQLEMHRGESALVATTIIMFYRHSDIDLIPDGVMDGVGDIGEDTLTLYYYDDIAARWEPVSTNLAWVISFGKNDTDIEIYGEVYAGYVWAEVTDFPLLTVAGTMLGWSAPAPPWALILSIVGGGFAVAAFVLIFRRWRRNRSYGKKMGLFDELLESS
jgi:hypothetical protein